MPRGLQLGAGRAGQPDLSREPDAREAREAAGGPRRDPPEGPHRALGRSPTRTRSRSPRSTAPTRRCKKVAARQDPAGAGHRRGEELGAPRPRRRRLPDRHEVGLRPAEHRASRSTSASTPTSSEPGTFKDREIMERDPHLLIEGSIISRRTRSTRRPRSSTFAASSTSRCAAAGGGRRGRTQAGYLGKNILGSGRRPRLPDPPRRRRLHLRRGDGAAQVARGQDAASRGSSRRSRR